MVTVKRLLAIFSFVKALSNSLAPKDYRSDEPMNVRAEH